MQLIVLVLLQSFAWGFGQARGDDSSHAQALTEASTSAPRFANEEQTEAVDSADLVQLSITRKASEDEEEDDEDDEDEEDELEACGVLEASGDCAERTDCVWHAGKSECQDDPEYDDEEEDEDEEENLRTTLDEGLIADVHGTELELREGDPKAFRKDQVMLEIQHGPSHIKGPCAFEGEGDEDNCRPMWRHSKHHRGIKDSYTHWPDGRLMLRNQWGRPRRATLQDFATNHYDKDVRNKAKEILAERGLTVVHATKDWMTPDARRKEFEHNQQHYARAKDLSIEQRMQEHREEMARLYGNSTGMTDEPDPL